MGCMWCVFCVYDVSVVCVSVVCVNGMDVVCGMCEWDGCGVCVLCL